MNRLYTHRTSAVAICMSLIGCSDFSIDERNTLFAGGDTGLLDAAEDGFQEIQLRLDVRPGGDLDLEPQSFIVDDGGDTSSLLIELSPSIEMYGTIYGFDATPYIEPTVPGNEEVPVQGRIHARIPGTIANNSATSDAEDGSYSLHIPAGTDYQLAVVPIEPSNLPFGVWTGEELQASQETDFSLGYGYPVYGVVEQGDESRLPSTGQLYLIDPETGFEGARTDTEANGHYLLRAHPGDYLLVFEGDDASYLPRIETPITVADEYGLRQDINVGELTPVEVQGRVLNVDGQGVKDAVVRFTSLSLDGAIGQATVETETDQAGVFSRNLLPGTWYAQFIPPYNSEGSNSPEELLIEVVGDESLSVSDIYLSERILIEGHVVAPSGEPVANVGITAIEQSFNGYSYSATTNGDGYYSMEVPDVALKLSLQPSTADLAITHIDLSDPDLAPAQLELTGGRLLSGQVLTPDGVARYTMIEIRDDTDVLYGATLTDIDGFFEVRVTQH